MGAVEIKAEIKEERFIGRVVNKGQQLLSPGKGKEEKGPSEGVKVGTCS